MKSYLVTGAAGFIGRHLMSELVRRGGVFHLVVEKREPPERLAALAQQWKAPRADIRFLVGDVAKPSLGLRDADVAALRGRVDHVFHLAAVYDMGMDERTARRVNVDGTRHALALARVLGVKEGFHHVSSIAVAGRYRGRFLEGMLDERVRVDHPYFESKFRSEQLVREARDLPRRIYRPGVVVGHSRTGVMDKIDGPYYLFPLIRALGDWLPSWLPLVGPEGGTIPLVPVDFVARAMDHIAHAPGLDGKTFHLVDPDPRPAADVIDLFCRAAGAPRFALRLKWGDSFPLLPDALRSLVAASPAGFVARQAIRLAAAGLDIPPSIFGYLDNPTTFDCRETERALEGSGIECPPLESYAARLWEYWARHLDEGSRRVRALRRELGDKVVVITGASSGIGLEVARQVARRGARLALVSNDRPALDAAAAEIVAAGGRCRTYVADLRDLDACAHLVEQITSDHGRVDVLVNNAGRSIRRSIELSYDRLHDFQRTMQLNYFAAVRLVLGFLPGMRLRRQGQIINVSSVGVLSKAPRYAAYIASKAALDAFSRSIAAEVRGDGVDVTTVYMPLVRTAMIAPTDAYAYTPALSPAAAAELIVDAMDSRPSVVVTPIGRFAALAQAIAPGFADLVQNLSFRLTSDSAAARGRPPVQLAVAPRPGSERRVAARAAIAAGRRARSRA
jgi:short-subunit dehydrogenase